MKVRYVRLLFIAVALCCVVLPAMQAKAAVDIAGWDHSWSWSIAPSTPVFSPLAR